MGAIFASRKFGGVGTGADRGFFLGGGAPLRNDCILSEVKNFKSEYVYMKKRASS